MIPTSGQMEQTQKAEKIELELPAIRRSSAWNYFGYPVEYENGVRKVDKSRCVCNLCFTALRNTGNTTNMSTHLKRHHPAIAIGIPFKDDKISAPKVSVSPSPKPSHPTTTGQLRLTEVFQSPLIPSSQRLQTITKHIAMFIAHDMRPFSVVDSLGFRNLIRTLEPRYIIPSRTHFAEKVIPDLYLHTRQEVQRIIAHYYRWLDFKGYRELHNNHSSLD